MADESWTKLDESGATLGGASALPGYAIPGFAIPGVISSDPTAVQWVKLEED